MQGQINRKKIFIACSLALFLSVVASPCSSANSEPLTRFSKLLQQQQEPPEETPVEENEEQVEKPDSILPELDSVADVESNPKGELEKFEQEFAELKIRVDSLTRSPNDYKEFYFRLRPVIESKVARFKRDLLSDKTDLSLFAQINNDEYFQHLFKQAIEVKNLFYLREKVFNEAPPEFVALHTGTRLDGIKEARLELSYIQLELLIIAKATYDRFVEIPRRFELAPLDLIITMIKLLLLILVFYLWRSWAKEGFPAWRRRILSAKPVTSGRSKYARFIWYIDKTRTPLEWLIFINILLASLDILQIPITKATISTVAFWVCITIFTFRLLEKMIERGQQGLLKGISPAQSRSIKLLIWWFGLFMMIDSLLSLYIGEVTIFAWLSRLFFVLFIPVYYYLIRKWREDAFQFVAQERDAPEWIQRIHKQQSGIKGFISANVCVLYSIYMGIVHMFLQLISKAETGRRFTTEIYRKKFIADNKEVIEEYNRLPEIDQQLKEQIIAGDQQGVDSVHADHIQRIKQMLERSDLSHVSIVGERGIGKTFLLDSLSELTTNHLRLDCKPSFKNLLFDLAQQLNIKINHSMMSHIGNAIIERNIQLILIDNCHLLLSPQANGQKQLRRLCSWVNELSGKCLCVMTFNSSSWPLVKALGLAPEHNTTSIKLGAWTQSQIEALLEHRCARHQLAPDFSRLVIPRQLLDKDDETPEQRIKSGVYRIIWGYADGNPAISCRLLADSLALDGDKVVVKLPDYPDTTMMERYEITTLLLLRVICQFDDISLSDIKGNLCYRNFAVKSALARCQAQGMVDFVNDHYSISWLWYRSVSRYLSRQNLLIR
ncbi:AAA family ATPase [Thalassotalea mangrovi]|uniref:ATP-binding protein n=1 Tax=Thalassotalea mangrovi TaxID=2572245 RepID=A0A4V5NUU6_9GAMM|nr:AAA family ATPase [Thalassotalea mangrovi]TKB47828.1 ATP-binding protein [Thalassotalea mangrovi]